MIRICLMIFCLLIMGCSHGGLRINGVDDSLADIRRSVESSLPLGKRTNSINGREFFSNYFIVSKKRKFLPARRAKVRYFAHIYILGDRRPYILEVLVRREQAEGGGAEPNFRPAGQNDVLAKVVFRRLKKQLAKRREDRNIIDDFRVF